MLAMVKALSLHWHRALVTWGSAIASRALRDQRPMPVERESHNHGYLNATK